MLCLFHIQHKVNAITKTTTFQGLLRNFVNNHIRLIRSRGLDFVKGLHDFWLEALHDVLQLSDVDATRDLRALSDSIQKSCLGAWRKLLARLNNPPVTCVVCDGLMTFTLKLLRSFATQKFNSMLPLLLVLWPICLSANSSKKALFLSKVTFLLQLIPKWYWYILCTSTCRWNERPY